MRNSNNELKERIRDSLRLHGKLSILFYKTLDEWIVHKWGEFDRLSLIHKNLFEKYKNAGFEEEAESLTLMDLPNDVEIIYQILTCGSLEKTLKEIGFI